MSLENEINDYLKRKDFKPGYLLNAQNYLNGFW